jgi:DNA modification methylase
MIPRIHIGDSLAYLRQIPDNYYHAIVTDAPYGLSSAEEQERMQRQVLLEWSEWLRLVLEAEARGERDTGPATRTKPKSGIGGKEWDAWVPGPDFWYECFRVLRPGGYLLTFSGTRTFDLMGMALRLAGFQQRGMITWHYATGMPRGLNIGLAIDDHLGVSSREGELSNRGAGRDHTKLLNPTASVGYGDGESRVFRRLHPASEEGKRFEDWHSGLKPATEPISVVQKPISEATIAENMLKWGTGGFNIKSCRIGSEGARVTASGKRKLLDSNAHGEYRSLPAQSYDMGRFPANVVMTHAFECTSTKCVVGCPVLAMHGQVDPFADPLSAESMRFNNHQWTDHDGFVYCPKPTLEEKDLGLQHLPPLKVFDNSDGTKTERWNPHVSVKPVELMRWCLNLITAPGGEILDPFAGSGTTGVAAVLNRQSITLIERDPAMESVIYGRCDYASREVQGLPQRPRYDEATKPKPRQAQVGLFGE